MTVKILIVSLSHNVGFGQRIKAECLYGGGKNRENITVKIVMPSPLRDFFVAGQQTPGDYCSN